MILVLAFWLIPVSTSFGDELQPYSQIEVHCLAVNIHHEARGEPYAGQKAVAFVTLNRTKTGKFPSTICNVVYQPGQFSWVNNKTRNPKIDPKIVQLAHEVLLDKYQDPTMGALYFHNTSVNGFKRKMVARIGNHIFYK